MSKSMNVFLFPGQGSQHKGMGEGLFQKFPSEVSAASEILGYSVSDLCLQDKDGLLGQTLYTQPCLFVVNALSFLKKMEDGSSAPNFVAGHSLGEFNALFAAGVFDFLTGVRLVRQRAQLMSQAQGGGMAAILKCPENTIRAVLDEQFPTLDIANLNSPNQIVISGEVTDLDRCLPALQKEGATCIRLRVSAAFHSRHMRPAMEAYSDFLKGFQFDCPKIPVISNVTALPHSPETLTSLLARQIVSSVRWTESILYLIHQGVSEFVELGPGKVLTKLAQEIQKSAPEISQSSQPVATQISKPSSSQAPIPPPKQVQETPKSLPSSNRSLTADRLGAASFRRAYHLKYAYVAGSMYKGIASKELVVRMARAGFLSFFGSGGVRLSVVEEAIQYIQSHLSPDQPYGMNLISNIIKPALEMETVELFLRCGVRNIEASAYMQISPALVYFRAKGLRIEQGRVVSPNRILAKISRPEVAQAFLSPAPDRLLEGLRQSGKLSEEETRLARAIPMADDLCVEADSAGHTDMGVASALIPTIIRQRDSMMQEFGYANRIHVGAAGGIGTPESAAAALILGADFILTGSINQCTVESGMSAPVKDMLQQINVQDTTYAPAGDMFEIGAKVQVMKRGLFFPARASKLYDLWQRHNSLDEIDEKTKIQIQEKFFGRSFEDVYEETKTYYLKEDPETIAKAERQPKHKMALIFRWYFIHSMRLALKGETGSRVDFQVHCGPALGAFNQWVKGSPIENWRQRHVDSIAIQLMEGTAELLESRFFQMMSAE
jgi:trans-AT polyketide synthase/acyltransferase/oxidoreductase domain-containing protein